MAIATVALIGLLVAIYLTLYKTGVIGSIACSIGSCETVQSSKWATFLGLPVAAWGIGFYASVLAVSLVSLQERWEDSPVVALVQLLLTGWGVLFSTWLTWLELYVIRAICTWCVVSAVLVVVLAGLALLDWRETRRAGMTEEPATRQQERSKADILG